MKPVAIIGGGIAALGAASVLRHAVVPYVIVEAHDHLGGRMRSFRGEGWIADAGCPYFRLNDSAMYRIIREVGLEFESAVLQDATARQDENGSINRIPAGYGGNRVALKRGMDFLFEKWQSLLTVYYNTAIGALKWEPSRQCFLLRDVRTGRAVRNSVDHELLEASGVILAVPGNTARTIVQSSRALKPLEKYYREVEYSKRLVGIFRVSKFDPGYCVLEMNGMNGVEWLCLEERKHPSRVEGPWSIVTAWASNSLMESKKAQHDLGALDALYASCREVIPELPNEPEEQHLVRWNAAHPTGDSIFSIPSEGVPTEPAGLPFALAGDYTMGDNAEAAAKSGIRAAEQVLKRL